MGDPNKELISFHQAQMLMLAVLVIGLLVGGGNFALWTLYNAITERLGLDTVKNLLVNLALFVVLGVVIGLGVGRYAANKAPESEAQD